MTLRIEPVAEDSLILYLGDRIDADLAPRIGELCRQLRQALGDTLVEVVPSYTSILVQYRLQRTDFAALSEAISQLARDLSPAPAAETGKLIELPVCYHPEVAPDLLPLARRLDLDMAELIARHSGTIYRVFAIGFAPGFAFLGEVDPIIAAPRHRRPRPQVLAGSVGIAERQTGIYPAALPGGWQIVGNCPTPLYCPDREPTSPFSVGDRVRFVPIDRQQHARLGGQPWPG